MDAHAAASTSSSTLIHDVDMYGRPLQPWSTRDGWSHEGMTVTTGESAEHSSRRLLRKRARGLTARTTCIHPQLRDLLVCPIEAGHVVTHAYHSLALYSLGRRGRTPARRNHLQTLNFIPNVLIRGCGLLAAGGHTAELAIRSADPSSRWCIQMHVGKSINNSISVSPSPFHPLSVPRVHISNNDHSVYLYDVHFPKRYGSTSITDDWDHASDGSPEVPWADVQPELEYLDRLRLETPINHTSVSPDGRSLIAVGDTNQIFLFDINAHGQHTLIDTLEATQDAAFSTSWSRTGEHFAVASQDGYVTIFDRRRLVPMKQFRTHQIGPSGAARVVKYSQGPHELLAFTEQKNYVHVVDARTYEYEEIIYLPAVELESHSRVATATTASIERAYESQSAFLSNIIRQPYAPRNINNSWDALPSDSNGNTNNSDSGNLGDLPSSLPTLPFATSQEQEVWQQEQDCPPYSTPFPSVMHPAHRQGSASIESTFSLPTMAQIRAAYPSMTQQERRDALVAIAQHHRRPRTALGLANSISSSNNSNNSASLARQHEWFPSSFTSSTSSASTSSAQRGERDARVPRPSSTSNFAQGSASVSPTLMNALALPTYSDTSSLLAPSSWSAAGTYGTEYTTHTPGPGEPYATVAGILGTANSNPSMNDTYDEYTATSPTLQSPVPGTFGGGGPGSSAITGLDWDPTGRFLYTSMERIVLEWQVDGASRRCHPHASAL